MFDRFFARPARRQHIGVIMLMTATFSMQMTACVGGPTPRRIDASDPMLVRSIADKTVMLTNNSICAGVWISEHEILTANHCVKRRTWCTPDAGMTVKACSKLPDSAAAVFYFRTRDEFIDDDYNYMHDPTLAILVRHSDRSDLALLHTRRTAASYARIATEEPTPGSSVHVIGHPDSKPYRHVFVNVKRNVWATMWADDETAHDRRITVVSYMAAGGTSGGGAWNERGELVGTCLSRARWKILNESHFASVEEIRAFIGLTGPMSPHNE